MMRFNGDRMNSTTRFSLRLCVVAIAFLSVARPRASLAVTTSHWVQADATDFNAGTLDNVVVTNQGDVKLSREISVIQEQDPNITTVNALAQTADGTIYAGTGPKGILLAVKDSKVTTAATIDAVNILSLMVDSKGGLVLGTGGDRGRVLIIPKPGDKPKEIFSQDGVQYIWALQQTPDGNIYAATGPNGQVFEIKPDGSHDELYKCSEDNITSMISDGKDLLYLGTDPNGLVIRLNRKTKEAFYVYNAGETEITALALDGAGNLYAATGQVSEHQANQAPEQPEKPGGRPESGGTAQPIPPNPIPAPPQPTPPPNPNPGEPKPIPKGPSIRAPASDSPKMMGIMTDGPDDPGGGGGDNPGGGGGNGPGDQPGPGQNPAAPQPAANRPPTNNPAPNAPEQPAPPQAPEGNSIYEIDSNGFVTQVFSEDVVIYSMILQGNSLIVGTGDDGDIYQVDPDAQETAVLAKVDAKQVVALLPAKDGSIYIGIANTGGISQMSGGYASEGTYLSPVLDATQVSRFGRIQLHGLLPTGTRLQLATRSGNVKDADSPGWSPWSNDVDAEELLPIRSPAARFLQYRLTFSTTDPSKSASVDHVDVAYQIPNMAPVVKSIRIGASGGDNGQSDNSQNENSGQDSAQGGSGSDTGSSPRSGDNTSKTPGGTGVQTITWEASDPNNDSLTYTLYFRRELRGPWVLLKDRLTQTSYDWDTRTVADGPYQVKVVASDALANPPGEGKTASRVSEYFVVDNTPPTIGDVNFKVDGNSVTINLRTQDRTSAIANVEYTVDSSDQWQSVLPLDGIFDAPDEPVRFSIKGLTPGEHQVTIRATDAKGNQALQSLIIKTGS
jgi:hypothetical protein